MAGRNGVPAPWQAMTKINGPAGNDIFCQSVSKTVNHKQVSRNSITWPHGCQHCQRKTDINITAGKGWRSQSHMPALYLRHMAVANCQDLQAQACPVAIQQQGGCPAQSSVSTCFVTAITVGRAIWPGLRSGQSVIGSKTVTDPHLMVICPEGRSKPKYAKLHGSTASRHLNNCTEVQPADTCTAARKYSRQTDALLHGSTASRDLHNCTEVQPADTCTAARKYSQQTML